jgi:hypothetical protein
MSRLGLRTKGQIRLLNMYLGKDGEPFDRPASQRALIRILIWAFHASETWAPSLPVTTPSQQIHAVTIMEPSELAGMTGTGLLHGLCGSHC